MPGNRKYQARHTRKTRATGITAPDARLHKAIFYLLNSSSAPVNLPLDNDFSINWSRFDQPTEPNVMPSRVLLIALFLAFALYSTVQAQTTAPTLEERMSQEEFSAAGLDHLTPEQLQFLNGWIQSKGISTLGAPIQHKDGSVEFYADEGDRELIESSIVGEFSGWTGKTKVTLENGQVWQQAEASVRGYSLNSPKVRSSRCRLALAHVRRRLLLRYRVQRIK